MSENWDSDWFPEDPAYSNILSTINQQPLVQQGPPSTQSSGAALSIPNYGSRYPYEYGQSFGGSQVVHPSGGIGDLSISNAPSLYHQSRQPRPPSTHSSPRFEQSASSNVRRRSTERSQPSTPRPSGLLPMLPSQQMHLSPATAGVMTASIQSQQPKRTRTDSRSSARSPKRRTSASVSQSSMQCQSELASQIAELSDEERLLIQLKQEQNLPWKEIAKEFESRLGRPFQVPALQMRYKRLRERLRPWTDEDVAALEAAHEYWETNKFEMIASKMLDYGLQDRWPARYCEKKWEELHPETASQSTERAGSQQRLPLRSIVPEGQNYTQEWPMPSPPRDMGNDTVMTNAPLAYATTSTMLPRNPILPEREIPRSSQGDPT